MRRTPPPPLLPLHPSTQPQAGRQPCLGHRVAGEGLGEDHVRLDEAVGGRVVGVVRNQVHDDLLGHVNGNPREERDQAGAVVDVG